MRLKKVIVGNHFQEQVYCVEIETGLARYRILAEGNGIKIRIIADDSHDVISIKPMATNMIAITPLNEA